MRTRGRYHKLNDWRISHPAWQWTWGQGLDATPLAMARVAATLVDGSMPVTRFRMDSRPSKVRIVDSDGNLRHLRSAMRDESLKLGAGTRMARAGVYGKSGTAERSYSGPLAASGDRVVKVNDAWYICTVPDCRITRNVDGRMTESTGPIAVAVRVERTAYMSGVARLLVEEVVLKTLHELGYIPALD
jgi:cell division protein FtsI/penicillin-binding protein 2